MKKQSFIKAFLKFGQEEHIRDLCENGTIFMNSVQYFRHIDDNCVRGDMYEGISKIKNYPPGELEIKSLNYKGKYLALQIRAAHETVLGNIYSLYCISSYTISNPLKFQVDDRIKQFGSHALLIKDNPEFINRIEKRLQTMELPYRHGFVKYYDTNKKNGMISIFHKPKDYYYQNEFRFYVYRPTSEPLLINIGSLEGIAEMYKAEDIIDTLKLTVSPKKKAY